MGTSGKPAEDVFVPTEQDSVEFYGHPLVAVRLADSRICAVLRWLCDSLHLDPTGQVRRIQRKSALADGLINVRVDTPGGPQVMPALTLDVLPGWLFGIDEHRVKPETRQDVIVFQRECVKVLAQHFANKPRQSLPAPDTLVLAELMERPEKPATDADDLAWAAYHEAMAAWIRWRADLERWRQEHDRRYSAMSARQDALEDRIESVEEVSRLIPEILDRLGPETLSPEHQATVKNLAKRLNDLGGFSYATIYGELNAAFHVGKYTDIPTARWADVLAWFKLRLDAAERHHPR